MKRHARTKTYVLNYKSSFNKQANEFMKYLAKKNHEVFSQKSKRVTGKYNF